jgi:hypothetical protein
VFASPFLKKWLSIICSIGFPILLFVAGSTSVAGEERNINLIPEPLIKQSSIIAVTQDTTGFLWFGTVVNQRNGTLFEPETFGLSMGIGKLLETMVVVPAATDCR